MEEDEEKNEKKTQIVFVDGGGIKRLLGSAPSLHRYCLSSLLPRANRGCQPKP